MSVPPLLRRAFTATAVSSAVAPRPPSPTEKRNPYAYKLEAAELLPVLNLRLTVSWYLLGPTTNLKFLQWTKRNYKWLSYANNLGAVIGAITLVVPETNMLLIPACLLFLPAPCCSYAMLSIDMLLWLTMQYEFWFFTVMNVATWATLAALYQDERVVFLAIVCIGVELWVAIDANFRTFVPVVKSCVIALPLLLVYTMLVFLHLVDIPASNFQTIHLVKLEVNVVDLFVNAMMTLVVFLLRKAYNKRKLLYRRHANTRLVRCVISRCSLRLQPLASHASTVALKQLDSQEPCKQAYASRVLLKQLGITAQKIEPTVKVGRAINPRQQVTLVSLKLSTIDLRRTVWSQYLRMHECLQPRHAMSMYAVGAVGLLCSGGSMLLNSDHSHAWFMLLPVVGFVCTAAFTSVFVCASQRDLVRALLRNFAFLFPSLQFALACLCLADAMHWDSRCWAIAAYGLWFHWLLLLDALAPPTRRLLLFRKQIIVPVVAAIWIGICSVLYAILIDSPKLADRILIEYRVGQYTLVTGTKMMLLNRIVTIMLWTVRLTWLILHAGDTELVLLRGCVDYYSPFDTFTGLSKSASVKSIVPGDGKRVDSDGSLVLALTSHYSHRKSLLRGGPRRPSSQARPSISPARPSISGPRASRSGSIVEIKRALTASVLATELSPRTMASSALPLCGSVVESTPPQPPEQIHTQ